MASTYHWSIDQVLNLTAYELELLTEVMLERYSSMKPDMKAGKGKKQGTNFKKKAMKVEDALNHEMFKGYIVDEG